MSAERVLRWCSACGRRQVAAPATLCGECQANVEPRAQITIDDILHPGERARAELKQFDAQLACLDSLISILEAARKRDAMRTGGAA